MIYVLLADGFEEIEAVTPIDILRRAGFEVKTAAVGANPVTGAHGICIAADTDICSVSQDDARLIILPGGMPGTANLDASGDVRRILHAAHEKGALIGAICAAPSVLGHLGLLNGKKAVCFPGFEDELAGAEIIDGQVAADGTVITARGAGAAAEFGFTLVSMLAGAEKADSLRREMQYSPFCLNKN